MRPIFFFVSALFLTVLPASAQSKSDPEPSAPTLKAILAEIRQFREDLRSSTIAFQRAQILLHRVQLQDAVVRRLQEKVDENRTALTQIQGSEKRIAEELKATQDALEQVDKASQKQFEDNVARLKSAQEEQASSEQETQARLAESEDQLRLEQAKLERLQDELDRLDASLQQAAQGAR